jgi:hypothetical protein
VGIAISAYLYSAEDDAVKNTHDVTKHPTTGNLGRWIGLLLPAAAWATDLQALYLTSEYGCVSANFTWNHVTTFASLAASIAGGIVSWMYIPAAPLDPLDHIESRISHKRFLGILGVILSIFFSVVIVAQWLPTLIGVPCHK